MTVPGTSRRVSRLRSTRALQANFRFATRPADDAKLRVDWFRGRQRIMPIPKEPAKVVTSTMVSRVRLMPGRYKAVLYVKLPRARCGYFVSAAATVG